MKCQNDDSGNELRLAIELQLISFASLINSAIVPERMITNKFYR